MEKSSIEQFDNVCEDRIEKIVNVLLSKAKEYAQGDNRYHNFEVAARAINTTREKALLGMMLKHWASVLDIIENPQNFSKEIVDEKIGDMINYLILLEGMLLE